MRSIAGGVIAISAIAIAFVPLTWETSAQPTKSGDGEQPACAVIKLEEMCRARDDCIWVPAAMTFRPRPAHCRAKPVGPPGIFTK